MFLAQRNGATKWRTARGGSSHEDPPRAVRVVLRPLYGRVKHTELL
jgi:hypothetical protein